MYLFSTLFYYVCQYGWQPNSGKRIAKGKGFIAKWNLKKADGEGGPNDPDANGIILEPSRQAEFEVQQVWRPEDKSTAEYLQK